MQFNQVTRVSSPMTASTVRPLTNPLSRHVTSKPFPSWSEHRLKASITIHIPYPKRRRYAPIMASLHGDDDDNNNRPALSSTLSRFPDGSGLRVAYKGVHGANSESAVKKAYPKCEALSCKTFEDAFEAVQMGDAKIAVLPIENSSCGSIHSNYDLLLRDDLHIVGEVKVAIHHCLLANHGVKLEDLKRVLSHPQALAQCEYALTRFGLVREEVYDTAAAAEHIKSHKLKDTGAVVRSDVAANIYGLNILAEDIQDDCDNIVTRFLMLAREPIIPRTNKPFKTSIVFSLEEGPGVLSKALDVFAQRKINLTKIESRPVQKKLLRALRIEKYFNYLFFVDLEASMADQKAKLALKDLEEFGSFLRVLGSYPVDMNEL
ncbi:arogenate dehydratase 2-like isoform X2 [Corylus avellana]|uniref:arogenate dehydratase 2-like isoform X2 n=1 Tax=Corylus avellana TaxID=13451 RepID=UPI00286B1538|nr:arogenate dehydratase 2-like isoform X2 [Corylus avellana]